MLATDAGIDRGQDRLQDLSPAAVQRRRDARKVFLARLQRIDKAGLSIDANANAKLLLEKLQTELADDAFGLHLMPINNREGIHINFPELPRAMDLRTDPKFYATTADELMKEVAYILKTR